ncbi:MAG: AAA family ATPase, partial [Myxococcales bacterium]|nr:AAA family ATPase [Myxococcales bacterium]
EIYCSNCREVMRASDRFCANCGSAAPEQQMAASGQRKVTRRSTRALRQASGEATAEVLLRALPQRLAGEAANALLAAGLRRLESPQPGLQSQLIAGAPGSGKTRLLDEIAEGAMEKGLRVIAAGCEATGAMTALWPIRQAVAALLNVDVRFPSHGDIARAASLIGLSWEALPGLNELFGLNAGMTSVEYAVRRRECFTSAVQALTEGAAGRPLLLLFDDIDRWDAPSRRIIQQLVGAQAEAPVLLLMSTAEEQRDWLSCPVVELPRLDRDEILTWVQALSSAASTLPERLASHTPLTPFDLELALRCLPAEGEPVVFATVVTTWLEGLAAPERQILQLCAVLGEQAELDELDTLRATDPEGQEGDIRQHLLGLQQAGLLAGVGENTWAFRSRRVREFVLAGIDRERG